MVSCLSSAASGDSSASLILRKSSGVFTRSRSGVFNGRSAMFMESPAHFDLNPPAGKLANGAVEVDVDDSPVVTCFARQVVEREDLSVGLHNASLHQLVAIGLVDSLHDFKRLAGEAVETV